MRLFKEAVKKMKLLELKKIAKEMVMILHLKISRWLRLQWRKLNLEQVRFGSLRKLQPISRCYGRDRGQPIDRYYIEAFLQRYSNDIKGRVLEFKDSYYTHKFGRNHVTKSDVLNLEDGIPESTIVADIARASHIPSEIFDCIICTQTLQYIYDLRSAMHHLHRILKPGGILLATFPGISKIDKCWIDYWRFTSIPARRLFEDFFPTENVAVETYGNILTSIAFLHGLAVRELKKEELEYKDPLYELVITVKAVKPFKNEEKINFCENKKIV
jgi:SAM-dependent methyltransferase